MKNTIAKSNEFWAAKYLMLSNLPKSEIEKIIIFNDFQKIFLEELELDREKILSFQFDTFERWFEVAFSESDISRDIYDMVSETELFNHSEVQMREYDEIEDMPFCYFEIVKDNIIDAIEENILEGITTNNYIPHNIDEIVKEGYNEKNVEGMSFEDILSNTNYFIPKMFNDNIARECNLIPFFIPKSTLETIGVETGEYDTPEDIKLLYHSELGEGFYGLALPKADMDLNPLIDFYQYQIDKTLPTDSHFFHQRDVFETILEEMDLHLPLELREV